MTLAQLVDPISDPQQIPWSYLALGFMAFVAARAIVLEGGLMFVINRTGLALRRRVLRLPYGKGQLLSEFKANLVTIFFDGVMIATLAHFVPPTPASQGIFISFIVSAVWFEIWFYVSHRVLHSKALYFIHRQHHVAVVTNPLTAMSFSLVERMILLVGGFGGILMVGLVYPLATFGVALYLFANYMLNLFAHTNIEIVPPVLVRSKLTNWLNAPTYHALHHARYDGHYGLYTPFLDWMFNSRFEDYEAIHKMAYEGQGLTHRAQRIKIDRESAGLIPGSPNPAAQIG
jgi:Delta7-sterol 5-desaturase